MTVASLWKALDRAGCGRPVGIEELRDHHRIRAKTNPWNYNEMEKKATDHRPALAVDLSIWICEALTSSEMKNQHIADPSLSLVYNRTLKLLNLGIKLVVVIEGKRRIRQAVTPSDNIESECFGSGSEGSRGVAADAGNGKENQRHDKFRKRRGGAPFWSACQRCEKMLLQMGVTVVRAKAEGEALCALLNQRGVVDGVISKDGDCFLFGAKVMYTKFSIDNLEQKRVMRYDIDDLRACVDDEDGNQYDQTRRLSKDGHEIVKLSRDDLIAFAVLTGSDLVGEGVTMVGCRKAIRFIRKCQIDNPLKVLNESESISPALELLKSWEKLARRMAQSSYSTTAFERDRDKKESSQGPICSCCGHSGTKSSHKKHGCKECGTEPGEYCLFLSPGARFKASLHAKVMELKSEFGPMAVADVYLNPNDNQLPLSLVGTTARTLQMRRPRFEDLMKSSFIVRGRSLTESRAYLQKSVAPYMARFELFRQLEETGTVNNSCVDSCPSNGWNQKKAVPVRLNGRRLKNGNTCFEVSWMVKATMTDDKGNPINEFEFSTIEQESMIKKCYPNLINTFAIQDKGRKASYPSEQENRLENFLKSNIVIGAYEERNNGMNTAKDSSNNKKNISATSAAVSRRSLQRPVVERAVEGASDDVQNLRQMGRNFYTEQPRGSVARVLFQHDKECDNKKYKDSKYDRSVSTSRLSVDNVDTTSFVDRVPQQEPIPNKKTYDNKARFHRREDRHLPHLSGQLRPEESMKHHFDHTDRFGMDRALVDRRTGNYLRCNQYQVEQSEWPKDPTEFSIYYPQNECHPSDANEHRPDDVEYFNDQQLNRQPKENTDSEIDWRQPEMCLEDQMTVSSPVSKRVKFHIDEGSLHHGIDTFHKSLSNNPPSKSKSYSRGSERQNAFFSFLGDETQYTHENTDQLQYEIDADQRRGNNDSFNDDSISPYLADYHSDPTFNSADFNSELCMEATNPQSDYEEGHERCDDGCRSSRAKHYGEFDPHFQIPPTESNNWTSNKCQFVCCDYDEYDKMGFSHQSGRRKSSVGGTSFEDNPYGLSLDALGGLNDSDSLDELPSFNHLEERNDRMSRNNQELMDPPAHFYSHSEGDLVETNSFSPSRRDVAIINTDNSSLGNVLSKLIEAEVKRRIAIEINAMDGSTAHRYL
jgi:XPG I-region/Chromatin organization modifier domain 2